MINLINERAYIMVLIEHIIYNYIDFYILRRYYRSCFCTERKYGKVFNLFVHCFCVIALSIINLLGIPNLNLLSTIVLMFIYLFTFVKANILSLIIYIGIGFIAEPIGFFITRTLVEYYSLLTSYRISMLISLIVRFILIYFVCKFRRIHMYELPSWIKVALGTIPIISILECCIVINWSWQINDDINSSLLGVLVVLTSFLINFIVFWVFEQYQLLSETSQQNSIIIMEAKSKELYYQEVEESNHEIRRIRHDLKNRLLGIVSLTEDVSIKKNLFSIVDELEASNKTIFTENTVLNTILNTKLQKALVKQINFEISIRVPAKIDLDYGDAGILLGNLLDNSIESAEQVQIERRWIRVDIVYKKSILLIEIHNSKLFGQRVSKYKLLDEKNHGLGLKSVQKIIEKYNGSFEKIDKGDEYEVTVLLYGIHILAS